MEEIHLPHDVILNNILPTIPRKSVCRFKCVSKEWRSFLTSAMFQTLHDYHTNNSKFLILSKTETAFESITIDFDAPLSDKGLSPTRRPLPPFEGIAPGKVSILASSHGLVCLGISIEHESVWATLYSDLILWNPLTNEYKRLSKFNSHKECNTIWCSRSDFGLYYSCFEDDYKLLFVNYDDRGVYIYSLRSDSWREVGVFQHMISFYPVNWNRGTYLEENLYFLQRKLDPRFTSIIRFDTKTERLSKIEIPNVDAGEDAYGNYFATIMVKSDCIHVCVKYSIDIKSFDGGFRSTKICMKLWKLDESGIFKEVLSYQLTTHKVKDIMSYLSPIHIMMNGKWLMRDHVNRDRSHEIYEVDLKKKMHIIKDKGEGKEKEKGNIYDDEFEYSKVRMDDNTDNRKIIVDEVRYIATLVSPNRYMKY